MKPDNKRDVTTEDVCLINVEMAAEALCDWILARCKQEHHFLESVIRTGFNGVELMTLAELARWYSLAKVTDYEWFSHRANEGLVR